MVSSKSSSEPLRALPTAVDGSQITNIHVTTSSEENLENTEACKCRGEFSDGGAYLDAMEAKAGVPQRSPQTLGYKRTPT